MNEIPPIRVRAINDRQPRNDADFVLYWMIAYRRPHYNFALQRAVEWAAKLNKPLVIFEALRCGYRWASVRLHRFIIEGMADNAAHFARKRVLYYPYVEPARGHATGLLESLAGRASVVISDDFPSFFLPRMTRHAARQMPVRFEVVDSNGLLPMRAADKVFRRVFDFRRFLQKNLLHHLAEVPEKDPLLGRKLPILKSLPSQIATRWPPANFDVLLRTADGLRRLSIDHSVAPVPYSGGYKVACALWKDFLHNKLHRYGRDRNHPDEQATSGLSPYLHFGHISAHQMFEELSQHVNWTPARIGPKTNGSAKGWWGVTESVEAFLDQLIAWRELGYNMCWHRDDYDRFESLPEWAQETLAQHESDPRTHVYSLEQFEAAETHDEIWNAAQRQLIVEGRIHNYLRMLWGKKILEWTPTPRDALQVMIQLNNKYAVDGRDPNSYSGIFWVFGRYDRPWGPERPVFGKIRYMSSDNAARKLRLKRYLTKYGPLD